MMHLHDFYEGIWNDFFGDNYFFYLVNDLAHHSYHAEYINQDWLVEFMNSDENDHSITAHKSGNDENEDGLFSNDIFIKTNASKRIFDW